MKRVILEISITLHSDTIFGSGHSIPGGEDIAVNQDLNGYPFLKGSTFKGLFRESLTNLLTWTGRGESDLNRLLGKGGWNGVTDGERVEFSPVHLKIFPEDPESCFANRSFTSIENGIVKPGSLRTANCIKRHCVFVTELGCCEQDIELIKDAIAGIKYLGTGRTRGFGHVKCAVTAITAEDKKVWKVSPCKLLHYRLTAKTPIIVTRLASSSGSSYDTYSYLPGSAIRGMVLSKLAIQKPGYFEANKGFLLGDTVRFSNAIPYLHNEVLIPSLKGFYAHKGDTNVTSVLETGELDPGMKRAKFGSYCSIRHNKIKGFTPLTQSSLRIKRDHGESAKMFETQQLSAGQTFEGYIYIDKMEHSPKIASAFGNTVRLGADRFAGYGECTVDLLDEKEVPDYNSVYGYSAEKQPDSIFYMVALSPFTMVDYSGDPCGLNLPSLEKLLGVEIDAEHMLCSTALTTVGSYNRKLGCRMPNATMYDAGSVFKLICSAAPDLEKLLSLQRSGLGLHRNEGCGQVLFLRQDLFNSISSYTTIDRAESVGSRQIREARRNRIGWIIQNATAVKGKLSNSQGGDIQKLCQYGAIHRSSDKLLDYFHHNLIERGEAHKKSIEPTANFVRAFLNQHNNLPCEDSVNEKLYILSECFDYCRKTGESE